MKTTQQTMTRKNIAARLAGAIKHQWDEQQALQEQRLAQIGWGGVTRERR